MTCINEEYGMKSNILEANDIIISETATVTSVIEQAIDNGYKYTLTVKGVSKGVATITIPEKTILTNNEIGNVEVTSSEFEVKAAALCKRATQLHEETCRYQCVSSGHANNSIIKYGNQSVTVGKLTSGDAFDCDVNGDGIYDAATERFYYVTDLAIDSNYAVLIYYSNTNQGNPNASSKIAYDSNNTNYNGPRTAVTNLPTTTQWKNVSLASSTRQITNENGQVYNVYGGTIYNNSAFNYGDKAARLLTYQELVTALW